MRKPTDQEWEAIATQLSATPMAVGIDGTRDPKTAIRLLVEFAWRAVWDGTKDSKVRGKLAEIEALLDAEL